MVLLLTVESIIVFLARSAQQICFVTVMTIRIQSTLSSN